MAANTPAQTGKDAGAVSHVERDWDSIDWNAAHQNVCRLQMRIVKATKEKKWGKVKALQRILTRSFSGKARAANAMKISMQEDQQNHFGSRDWRAV